MFSTEDLLLIKEMCRMACPQFPVTEMHPAFESVYREADEQLSKALDAPVSPSQDVEVPGPPYDLTGLSQEDVDVLECALADVVSQHNGWETQEDVDLANRLINRLIDLELGK